MSSPGKITYYSAEEDKEIEVSPQFLEELKKLPPKTRVASAKWIAKGGAGVADAEDDVDFIGDTFIMDKTGDDSLDDPVLNPLKEYNSFQGEFVGKPQTPELSAFLDSAAVGLDKIDAIQSSIQYRKNTNAWLRNRQIASGSSQSVSSSLNPSVAPVQPSPTKLKPAAPGAGPNDAGSTKNNDNLERLIPYAKKWANVVGIPMTLVCAIMRNESGFRPWVVNDAAKSLQGAYGVMQMTLGTALGFGFSGYPRWAQNRSVNSPECRRTGTVSPKYGELYLPVDGAELFFAQAENKQKWLSGDNNMGRNPQIGSDLIHPETNIMFGCKLLQRKLAQASDFGCFVQTPDGGLLATDPKRAKENNWEIVSPVGLTGEDALRWALQMYNGDSGRVAYADRALNYMSKLEKALDPADTKPPTDRERAAAVASFNEATKGKGKKRQLASFNVAFLNSLRVA